MKPLLSMLLAVLLAGCSLFGGEEAAPAPSDVDQNILEQLESGGEETAVPATEEPRVAPEVEVEETAVPPTEPAPTETATPEAANESEAAAEGEGNAVAKNEKSTLRSGPGEEFPEIEATVENGESLSVLGLDESGDWANVALPNGENGWLPLEDIQLNTPLEDIGIVLTIPAIPALPTIQGVPDIPAIPTLPPINVP
ncbi:MAG: SH3 domain-containing protein [Ardenticatenaceae bacterium]|nr:SH3 domain-containing protein [Ardenticatenaceae bacterium]